MEHCEQRMWMPDPTQDPWWICKSVWKRKKKRHIYMLIWRMPISWSATLTFRDETENVFSLILGLSRGGSKKHKLNNNPVGEVLPWVKTFRMQIKQMPSMNDQGTSLCWPVGRVGLVSGLLGKDGTHSSPFGCRRAQNTALTHSTSELTCEWKVLKTFSIKDSVSHLAFLSFAAHRELDKGRRLLFHLLYYLQFR